MFSKYQNILVLDTPTKSVEDELIDFQGNIFSLKPYPNFPSTILEFTEQKQKAVYDKVAAEVLDNAHLQIKGESLAERLVFEKNHSLWHFAKFRVYHALVANSLLKSKIETLPIESQKRLLVISNQSLSVNSKKDNEIKFTCASEGRSGKKNGIVDLIGLGIQFLENGFSYWGRISFLTNAKNVFLFDRSMIQSLTIDGTVKGYFNPVLSYLEQTRTDESAIILDFQLPKYISKNALDTPYSARNAIYSEAVLLRGILSIMPVVKTIATSRKLAKNLNEWKINGGNQIIFNEIKNNWNYFKFHLLRYYCYQAIFSKKNKVAIVRDENNPFARSFWQAGETKGLFSVGNQHGAISEHSAAYLSNSHDHNYSSYPQLQFVWGEKWKTFINSQFKLPKTRMRVVGQLRTDVLKRIMEKHKGKKDFILFATQPIPNKDLLEQVEEIAFEAIKNSPNEQFVLKPHPKQIGQNLFAKFQSLANCVIEEEEDLYELLAKSKATITAFSTVGAETVFFKNPLITIDPLGQDIAGYTKEGIAQTCTNISELVTQIARVDKYSTEMIQNYDEFILQNFYKLDGNVAKRTWKEIENQL